jgi:hypothetical protein
MVKRLPHVQYLPDRTHAAVVIDRIAWRHKDNATGNQLYEIKAAPFDKLHAKSILEFVE